MSKRYPGNFITGNPVTLSQTSNNGIWDVKDQYTATGNNTWQESDGNYEISKSLRFRRSGSTYLSRTPSASGSGKTFTVSAWVKRSDTTNDYIRIFTGGASSGYNGFGINFASNGSGPYYIGVLDDSANYSGDYSYMTTGAFRDPAAWYHIVVAIDTTLPNKYDRCKIYVNGVQQPVTTNVSGWDSGEGSYAQNYSNYVNQSGYVQTWGCRGYYNDNIFDGYMTECYMIDGQALDPTYFGYTDPITGIWQPKAYTGSYGINGCYLPFNQTSSPILFGKNAGNPSNLLTYSEQFDNGAWSKPAAPVAATVSANTSVAPDGTTTADTVNYSGSTTHPCYQEVSLPTFSGGEVYTASMYVKNSTAGNYYVQCTYFYTAGGNQDGYANFTFDSGGNLINLSPSASYIQAKAQYVGNGWYRVSVTSTHQGGGNGTVLRTSVGQNGNAGAIVVWGAQINLGNTADTYLQTTSGALNQSWTVNNFATTDSMVDSPTNVFTTATDVGGVVSGNYCTISSIANVNNTSSNGGLSVSTGGNYTAFYSTHAVNTGKWYFEITKGSSGDMAFGLFQNYIYPTSSSNQMGQGPDNVGFYLYYNQGNGLGDTSASNNRLQYNGSNYGAPVGFGNDDTGAVYGCTLDFDTSVVTVYRNNDAANKLIWTMPSTLTQYPLMIGYAVKTSWPATTMDFNFGQRPFVYTPPAGYKSINSTNIQALGTSTVGKGAIQANKWFDINQFAGSGASAPNKITNTAKFAPDLVWLKSQDRGYDHDLFDTARGPYLHVMTNTNAVEYTEPAGSTLTSFNTDGFTLNGDNSGYGSVNNTGWKYIGYQWKQSPTSGFNVISYAGDGTNNRAISHNLGAVPAFIMVKARNYGFNWDIYHQSLGIGATLTFTTDPTRNYSAFGSTSPTSSNFYTQWNYTNSAYNYIAYVWAEVPGFSRFGSYLANASSDGPFIYTGFKPKFVMIKATGMTQEWVLLDSTRSSTGGGNPINSYLLPNATNGESTGDDVDFLSNGFKIRVSGSGVNYNAGQNYIYCAWAENPFNLNNRAR